MNSTDPRSTNRQHDTKDQEQKPKKLDLSLTQTLGGALAAMTAAALGSRLGVGGTIVGAAVASIIAGVGGTLYTASLRSTREKVKTVWSGRVAGTESTAQQATETPQPPVWDSPANDYPPRPSVAPRQRTKLPWKGMTVAVLSVFVLAAAALTTFEALSGSALSGGKGTTISQVAKEEPKAKHTKKPTSSDSASPSESPSSSKSPTSEPTATEQPSEQEPSAPATSATTEPSAAPSATEAPSTKTDPADGKTTGDQADGNAAGEQADGNATGDNKPGTAGETTATSPSTAQTPLG